ncbi:MAG: OB-fold nucleic acid binding domain-containing protein [Aureliella sp.]
MATLPSHLPLGWNRPPQPPPELLVTATAKGITFVTLEDETGTMNLVLKPKVWERHYKVARRSNAWLVNGILENREGIVHVVVGRLEDLSDQVAGLVLKSRDFH